MIRTIVVCEVQVPFVHGGAELHVRALVKQLRARGYAAERVSLPFKWYPRDEILAHAAAWRMIDLSEANGRPIDCVIATKFPAYFVRHPAKVTWLMHQYRAAYELVGTEYSDFDHVEADVALRDRLLTLDTRMLGESRRIFAGGVNISRRLEKFNGVAAEPLYHPPMLADRLRSGPYGDYVLTVGRIESNKRVELAVEAMAHVDPPIRLVVAGRGTQQANVEARAEQLGVRDRVHFAGDGRRRRAARALLRRPRGRLRALRRGLRLRDARGVSRSQAGRHRRRFRRAARVRRERRQRGRVRASARRPSPARSTGTRPIAGWLRRTAKRDTPARASSRGTGSSNGCSHGDGQPRARAAHARAPAM